MNQSTLPKPLTCTQLRDNLATAVRLTVYTGKVSRLGYSIDRDFHFLNADDARSHAARIGAASFNLYGWDGQNWSTDALHP